MVKQVHLLAGLVATLCIATFFGVSVVTELLAPHSTVAAVKSWIVAPGLFILVPAMIVTGATGFRLAQARKGALIDRKKRRMPVIVANGLLVLVPCAVLLNVWAAAGSFDARFYMVQLVELAVGALNLFLMGANIRDGLRLSGRASAPRVAGS